MQRRVGNGFVVAILLLIATGVAAAREEVDIAANDNQIEMEKNPAKDPDGKARLFETAIVVVSLGAMGAAASLHFLHAERKKFTSTIAKLEQFISGTCCISIAVQDKADAEPSIDEIQKTEEEREKEIKAIDRQEEELLDRYSEIESRITRLSGRL